MLYQELSAGVSMPMLGFGTFLNTGSDCERSVAEAIHAGYRLIDLAAYNSVKPAVNQIETHLYCQRQKEHEWERKYGVAHMAYAPLGQGHANEMFSEPVVCEIAAKYGKTPAQILLRRTIQDGVAVIPKSVHTQRIAENISIFDFELLLNMRSLLGQNRCLLQKMAL